jgi:hypothetical protein
MYKKLLTLFTLLKIIELNPYKMAYKRLTRSVKWLTKAIIH